MQQLLTLVSLFFFSIVLVDCNEYINIGEGALLSSLDQSYYGVVNYFRVSESLSEKQKIMTEAANQMGDACVGFMLDTNHQRASLMFDMSHSFTKWPPLPPALEFTSVQWNTNIGDKGWSGKGAVSFTTSTMVDKGWKGWQSFAKSHLLAITEIGEGTLVSENEKTWYSVRQFQDIGSNEDEVKSIMRRAIVEAGEACVGFHFRPIQPRLLEAALLYDQFKASSWPPNIPPALAHACLLYTSPSPRDA